METLNDYPVAALQRQLWSGLPECTASALARRLQQAEERLRQLPGPLFLSLGENCGPAIKLREAGLPGLGAGYFDNVVVSPDSVAALIGGDPADVARLADLHVDRWEGHDSVRDRRTGIWFHHYFHLRGASEKSDFSEGGRRRRIDEADIPLFLPSVQSLFVYLAGKLRLLLRAEQRKVLVLRRVDGGPVAADTLERLRAALTRSGARNAEIRVVHSLPAPARPGQHFIPEDAGRWGDAALWRAALSGKSDSG